MSALALILVLLPHIGQETHFSSVFLSLMAILLTLLVLILCKISASLNNYGDATVTESTCPWCLPGP